MLLAAAALTETRKAGMRVKAIGRYSSGSPKRCWDDSGRNTPRAISTAMKQVFRQPISAVPNTLVLAAATSSGRST